MAAEHWTSAVAALPPETNRSGKVIDPPLLTRCRLASGLFRRNDSESGLGRFADGQVATRDHVWPWSRSRAAEVQFAKRQTAPAGLRL